MRTVHVVQHTSAEYLGLIEDHLEGRGIRFQYSRPFAAKGSLPAPENVTTGLVSQWERGEKHPQGASLKLLALIAKNGLNGVA